MGETTKNMGRPWETTKKPWGKTMGETTKWGKYPWLFLAERKIDQPLFGTHPSLGISGTTRKTEHPQRSSLAGSRRRNHCRRAQLPFATCS